MHILQNWQPRQKEEDGEDCAVLSCSASLHKTLRTVLPRVNNARLSSAPLRQTFPNLNSVSIATTSSSPCCHDSHHLLDDCRKRDRMLYLIIAFLCLYSAIVDDITEMRSSIAFDMASNKIIAVEGPLLSAKSWRAQRIFFVTRKV